MCEYCHSSITHNPLRNNGDFLDRVFGLGSRAPGVCCISVTTEFELFRCWKLKYILESLTNLHQVVSTTCFASCASPQANSEEALSDVDNHSHDLMIAFIFERFSNCSKLCVKPKLVNVDQLLVLERVRPLSTMFVLGVFPFRPDAFLEEMVVGFQAKVGTSSDIVLFPLDDDGSKTEGIALHILPRTLPPNQKKSLLSRDHSSCHPLMTEAW